MKNSQKIIDGLKQKIEENTEQEEKSSEELLPPETPVVEEVEENKIEQEETKEEQELRVEEDKEEEEEEKEAAQDDEEPPKSKKAWGKMRRSLKEKDEELAKLRDAVSNIELKLAEQKGFQEALKQSPQPKEEAPSDPEPDALLDPEEHREWEIRQLKKENESLKNTQNQHDQFIHAQKDKEAISQLVIDYKHRNPDKDYDEARQFIRDREKRIIKIQYPQATDTEINSYLEEEEIKMFKSLAAQQQNATEVIYAMAEEYGYQKSSDASTKRSPNFKKLKENQEKNASFIGGTDAVKTRGVSPDQLLKMSMNQLVRGGKDLFEKAHKNMAHR